MKPAFGSTYFEDPTVGHTCALEYERLWERIAARVRLGVWFYRAREEVLAEEIPDIAKAFGKPVADRVQKAIQQTDPSRLAPAVKAQSAALCEAYVKQKYGRVSWINGLCLRWLGVHFW